MVAVKIPMPLHRQQRRCITFKDCPFAEDSTGECVHGVSSERLRAAKNSKEEPSMVPSRRPLNVRCHTVMNMGMADAFVEVVTGCFSDSARLTEDFSHSRDVQVGTGTSSQTVADFHQNRGSRRAKTMGAEPLSEVAVSIIAPGGGTGMNASVYAALARKEGFSVNILGQSRAAYDRYPASWANEGCPPPNLETFALDLAAKGHIQQTDCLVVGSRGGQVVLPSLWQALGSEVPPAVIMNGGCAMGLPTPVSWPKRAVSFLLLGGADYFRGQMDMQEYLAETKSRVPEANKTTAILLVHEMVHMPQSELLMAILQHMIRAVTSWKATANVPLSEFHIILSSLCKGGWSGKLTYKTGKGDAWDTQAFP